MTNLTTEGREEVEGRMPCAPWEGAGRWEEGGPTASRVARPARTTDAEGKFVSLVKGDPLLK